MGKNRSSHWRKTEQDFLKKFSTCEACGTKKRLNVHHIRPFHRFPSLELDPNNLITLCMSRKECHLLIGHGGSFKQWNPDVRKDAAEALIHPEKFHQLIEAAKAKARTN